MPSIALFGTPTVAHGAQAVALPFERRTQLACWLALRGGWVQRSEAAALLWPELDNKLAAANLRKTLFRLADLPWAAAVEQQGGALRWAGDTDVAGFERALGEGRSDEALALGREVLLAGFDDDANEAWTGWLRFERERLRAAWRTLALASLAGGIEPTAGLALAARLLEADPLDEPALRAQLELLAASGQGAQAMQKWDAFARRLGDELGLAPGPELLALRATLAAGAAASPAAAPAGAAAGAMAPRLPDDGFVGRIAELRRIAELFDGGARLVTLAGPGGIGKTRLAQHALAAAAGRFADGAHFVALEDAEDADTLLARIAQATGVLSGRAPALAPLGAALRGRELLLVLDNFEQLADAAQPVLAPLLAAVPGLALLVTSRVRLGLAAEHLLPLEGLPCPEEEDADLVESFDAARVFIAAALRVAPDLNPAAEAAPIADICRRLDGLPLALELAAAWTRVLSCAEIAAELREGAALLHDASGARAARHASIEQVFAQSWARLAPAEREALALLAVFQGGFTAEAARAVAGAALPVLGALADKSLLRKQGGRLSLHPLVQQLAAARLDPAMLAQARGAHAQWFHRVLAQLGPAVVNGEPAALRAVDDEMENGRQAWRWAIAQGDAALVHASGQVLGVHFDHSGRFEEGLALLGQAVAAPTLRADAALQAWLRVEAAHFEYRLDRFAEATSQAAAVLADVAADATVRQRAEGVIGVCALRQGRDDEAAVRLERAFALAEENGQALRAASVLGDRAVLHKNMGRYDQALASFHESLARYRALGHRYGIGISLANLGSLYSALDCYDDALPYLREAVAVCEQAGLAGAHLVALANLCDIALHTGQLDAAQDWAERAGTLARAGGSRLVEAVMAAHRARLALRRGRIEAAAAPFAEAAQAALEMRAPTVRANVLLVFAERLRAQGEMGAADRVLGFAAGQPELGSALRDQVVAERRRWGLPERSALAWPGMAIDELLRRLVAEAPLGHAPLVALLRG